MALKGSNMKSKSELQKWYATYFSNCEISDAEIMSIYKIWKSFGYGVINNFCALNISKDTVRVAFEELEEIMKEGNHE